MADQHPITPPEELVKEWVRNVRIDYSDTHWGYEQILCAMAARWGSDQELEACVAWLDDTDCEDPQEASLRLRWHRRPKPPSLKEQAIDALERVDGYPYDIQRILRALEALDD